MAFANALAANNTANGLTDRATIVYKEMTYNLTTVVGSGEEDTSLSWCLCISLTAMIVDYGQPPKATSQLYAPQTHPKLVERH